MSSDDPTAAAGAADAIERHTPAEDAQGLIAGVALVSLGVAMYKHAGLLTGGMAGAAFLLHYATGLSFGIGFFLLNLPFYWLAWRRMGRAFTLKTFAAVALLSAATDGLPALLRFERLDPLYAALCGGLLIGAGFIALFRHRASLGGVGILAFYLQDRYGWRAGWVQLAVDCTIVAFALAALDLRRVIYSVAGALVVNTVLAVNHRPGRYIAH